MEVILKEDIVSVGRAGEVVRVSDGFGRNYLLPQKKAVPATPGNLNILKGQLKKIEARREREKKEAEQVAATIAALPLVLTRETGEEDKLFGSITARHLAEALKEKGIAIDHRQIVLKQPIRSLGSFEVPVRLHVEVTASLKVDVKKS